MQLQCRRCGKGQRSCGCGILDHSAIKELPWAIVVLLGGGFALAEASKVTRFSYSRQRFSSCTKAEV